MAKKYDLVVGKPLLKGKSNTVNFDPNIDGIADFKFIILSHFFTNFEHFAAYPTLSISDGFQRSNGHFNNDPCFFRHPV